MTGVMMITYKVLCDTDINQEISMTELLKNEKVLKAIKSEFAKGVRNIDISSHIDNHITITSIKELHTFEVQKDDFADILVLAEEDASNKKLLKKGCSRVELVDIETLAS